MAHHPSRTVTRDRDVPAARTCDPTRNIDTRARGYIPRGAGFRETRHGGRKPDPSGPTCTAAARADDRARFNRVSLRIAHTGSALPSPGIRRRHLLASIHRGTDQVSGGGTGRRFAQTPSRSNSDGGYSKVEWISSASVPGTRCDARIECVIKAFTRPITRNNTAGLCSYPSNPVSSFNTITAVGDPRSLQFGLRMMF